MPWQYNGDGNWSEVYENPSTGVNRVERPTANSSANNPPPTLTDTSNKETTESTNGASSEYIEIEENILTGDLNVVPNPNYKAKSTILLQYLGKNLTGLYFVDKVTHTFNSDGGYTQSMSVSRNGFGSTIKSGSASKPVDKVAPTEGGLMNSSSDSSRPSSPQPATPQVEKRTYVIKSGDTLWAIATKYYGNGAKYTDIYNANKNIIKNPNLIYPGQEIVIP